MSADNAAPPADGLSRHRTKQAMRARKVSAKKGLGQNFLTDTHVLGKIIQGADIKQTDTILEIGPGLGDVTAEILRRAARVVVIEKDAGLARGLSETFGGYENLDIICADILQTDINAIIKGRFKVISNLPYYIASAVIMRMLEEGYGIESMTVMVQKEVGQRLTAAPGCKAYGALSVMARYYADITLLANVPPNCFYPRPRVDSALIHIIPRRAYSNTDLRAVDNRPYDPVIPHHVNAAALFPVIKAAFLHRRKTLANCLLSAGLVSDRTEAEALLQKSGFPPGIRGEALDLQDFERIADAYDNK